MEIVINICFGGFGLSHKAIMRYAEIKGIKLYPWISDVTKDVYGKRATIGNTEIDFNYATKPVKNEEDYKKKGGDKIWWSNRDIDRTDPSLIQTVKELSKEADGTCARLKVIKIPNNVKWEIEEYDGTEWVAEKHRTWR